MSDQNENSVERKVADLAGLTIADGSSPEEAVGTPSEAAEKTSEQAETQASEGALSVDGRADSSPAAVGPGPKAEAKDQVVVCYQKTVRLPNVTLPCADGVLIDVASYLPDDVDLSQTSIDYFYGRKALEDGRLRVYPENPGEEVVGVAYLYRGARCSLLFKLLANQDPKKLWVVNDPPSGSPFMKDLSASKSFHDDKVRYVAASRRGRSHEQAGTFRDDDFGFWSNSAAGIYLLVVADGAGSAKYSREGSRRAVQSAVDYLSPILTPTVWADGNSDEGKDGKVAQMLVSAANKALIQLDAFCKAENQKPNATEKYALKDFNTTLLIAAVRVAEDGSRQIVSFSIGDGAIAWVEPGKSELLCAPDGGEYSGQTRFLTTTSVWAKAATDWEAFRKERVFVKKVSAESAKAGFVALMTDGVSDPFFETDVKLHDASLWDDFILKDADVDDGEKSLKNILAMTDDKDSGNGLMTWLGFWSRGNHDDRTLAVLLPGKLEGRFAAAPVPPEANGVPQSETATAEHA